MVWQLDILSHTGLEMRRLETTYQKHFFRLIKGRIVMNIL